MKVIAHRGWSAGAGENTLEAFNKSLKDPRIDGVEFDIWEDETGEIVVVHNKPISGAKKLLRLNEVLDLFIDTNHVLLIEFKMYSTSMFEKVSRAIKQRKVESRTLLFAFAEVARDFPWQNRQNLSLGIISLYPWHIIKDIKKYRPNTIFFGWRTIKERYQFKLWWTFIGSLPCLVKKNRTIHFIGGVMFDKKDFIWLKKKGLYASTADMDNSINGAIVERVVR